MRFNLILMAAVAGGVIALWQWGGMVSPERGYVRGNCEEPCR